MTFLKTCRWHFLAMACLLLISVIVHLTYPDFGAIPRTGAAFTIIAALIAGFNTSGPIYTLFDKPNLVSSLPSLDDRPDKKAESEQARAERVKKAEREHLALRWKVPLWAGFGTFLWGFGDLLAGILPK